MIVFCEECGQKNDLKQPYQTDGTIRFCCRECRYQNRYTLNKTAATSLQHTSVLNHIQKIKGVIGTVLWDAEKGLEFHNMPQPLTPVDLAYIAEKIWECYQEAENAELDDIHQITYFIEQRHIFTKKNDSKLLLICCQSQDVAAYFADQTNLFRM